MSIISPTVGRIVLFRDGTNASDQAAIVALVWSDRLVNLCVFSPDGVPQPIMSVTLHQEGDDEPSGQYCHWMPYQLGQAAKTEAAEAATKA